MIVHSVSSVLTGHIDVICTGAYQCRIETARRGLFSNQQETLLYLIQDIERESDAQLMARLTHCHGLHPKVSLGFHKNIVDYLDGLGEEHQGITFEEAYKIVSVGFADYGDWEWRRGAAPLQVRPDFGSQVQSRISSSPLQRAD